MLICWGKSWHEKNVCLTYWKKINQLMVMRISRFLQCIEILWQLVFFQKISLGQSFGSTDWQRGEGRGWHTKHINIHHQHFIQNLFFLILSFYQTKSWGSSTLNLKILGWFWLWISCLELRYTCSIFDIPFLSWNIFFYNFIY